MSTKNKIFKALTCFVLMAFLFNSTAYTSSFNAGKMLTPELVSGTGDLASGTEGKKELLTELGENISVLKMVADFFLQEKKARGGLRDYLKLIWEKRTDDVKDYFEKVQIDINSVEFNEIRNRVEVEFYFKGGKYKAEIKKSGQPDQDKGKYDYDFRKMTETEKDLKGEFAPAANPLLQDAIYNGKVAEIYYDSIQEKLRIRRVDFIERYKAGTLSRTLALGEDIEPMVLFSQEEVKTLEEWVKGHRVREGTELPHIRIILGETVINWEDDTDKMNVAHSGVSDKSIYTGDIFLRKALQNKELLDMVFGNEEYQHLLGKEHGTNEERQEKLDRIKKELEEIEKIKKAMGDTNSDPEFLKTKIEQYLKENDLVRLKETLNIFNSVYLSQPLYPVEALYPMKKAIALMDGKDQQKLLNIIKGAGWDRKGSVAVNEIEILLDDMDAAEDWIKKFAPQLEGRTIWQVSPEIWYEAGGLARVMQYHGVGIKELIKGADIKLCHLEPFYQYRIHPNGEMRPLSYTPTEEKTTEVITHPVETLDFVDSFTVTVGEEKIKAEVYRGINEFGIEVFLIKDVEENGKSFFTHSLYNYRKPGKNNDKVLAKTERQKEGTIPTWEEFSVFYSKAVLEFLKRQTSREKSEKGKNWKAPFVHLNDSQTALVAVYKKMEEDRQDKQKKKDPEFTKDPFIEQAIIFFTTHTYMNRKEYDAGSEYGEKTMKLMGITGKYKELLKHQKHHDQSKHVYDMASSGLRCSDGQGAVSKAHRDDISKFDDWIEFVEEKEVNILKKMKIGSILIKAISNGDNRKKSASVFRKILTELYGKDANVEQPVPEQIIKVKRTAKETLRLSPGMEYFTSGEKREDGRILDPDKMVISYSGRLVPEKAGLKRAFTRENIEAFLKKGIQVVIYGNLQVQHEDSPGMQEYLVRLCEEFKEQKLSGKLIFVPRFTLNDQRYLLAATDIQVQDSDGETEAAGYTEADVSACGGLQCAPPRIGRGEGLLKEQGILIDFNVPGKGNTLVPEEWSAKGYRDVIMKAVDLGTEGLAPYQATSVRLSRILKAKLTGAAYLREFSQTIIKKIKDEERMKKREEAEEAEEKARTLINQIINKDDQIEYLTYHISAKILNGQINEAVIQFFSSGVFQELNNNLSLPAGIFNNLINAYSKDPVYEKNIRYFCRELNEKIIELSEDTPEDTENAVNLQIMTAQVLTIMFWIDIRTVPGAGDLRLTGDKEKAIQSDKGISFIDRSTLPGDLPETKTEGKPGFFWRGREMYKKLGTAALTELVYDENVYEKAKKNLVMYIMDHGFLRVSDNLINATIKRKISTLHETFFINNMIPGSYQATSTGEGHFQGDSLDIKYVTKGSGIQFNVRYDQKGEIAEIIAQEIKEGDWFFALPGYVDYVVNTGDLRFTDFSVKLSPEEIRSFNPQMDFSDSEQINAIKDQIEGNQKNGIYKHKFAPYVVSEYKGAKYLINTADNPELSKKIEEKTKWIFSNDKEDSQNIYETVGKTVSLMQFYNGISEKDLMSWITELAKTIKVNSEKNRSSSIPPLNLKKTEKEDIKTEIKAQGEDIDGKTRKTTLKTINGIKDFAQNNKTMLDTFLQKEENAEKIINIPVETVELVGKETVAGFLQSLSRTGKVHIRFYYAQSENEYRTVNDDLYKELGIEKRTIPADFESNRTNTITLLPVYKNKTLSDSEYNKYWMSLKDRGVSPLTSIITPIGENYDKAGIVRSVFLGMYLSEIAREGKGVGSAVVGHLKAIYRELCSSQGIESGELNIENKDLVELATGDKFKDVVKAINKLIATLPIMPFNVEEVKEAYEAAKAVVESA